jgi:hypothetical protein
MHCDKYSQGDSQPGKRRGKEGLFLRHDLVRCKVDPVGHGPVDKVERIDLQVNEVLEIEGLELSLAIHFKGDRDVVPHPLAGLDVVHTVRWNPGIMKLAMAAVPGSHGRLPATLRIRQKNRLVPEIFSKGRAFSKKPEIFKNFKIIFGFVFLGKCSGLSGNF